MSPKSVVLVAVLLVVPTVVTPRWSRRKRTTFARELSDWISNLTQRIYDIEWKAGTFDRNESFHVYLAPQPNPMMVPGNSVIPFNRAWYVSGFAMNTITGVYTVPASGTYYFQAVISPYDRGQSMAVVLCVDGTMIVVSAAGAHDNRLEQTTINAIVEVHVGQNVKLINHGPETKKFLTDYSTTFSGFRIRRRVDNDPPKLTSTVTTDIKELFRRVQQLKQKYKDVKQAIDDSRFPVAFCVQLEWTLRHYVLVKPQQTLIFDWLHTDIGSSFDLHWGGFFTAPVDGLYFFQVSFASFKVTQYAHAAIVLGDTPMAKGISDPRNSQGDMTTINLVTHTQAGTRVWIKNIDDRDNYYVTGNRTTFIGFLISRWTAQRSAVDSENLPPQIGNPNPSGADVRFLSRYTTRLMDQITALEQKTDAAASPNSGIAFFARASKQNIRQSRGPIVLDDILLNKGGHYANGVFVTPYPGIYFFQLVVIPSYEEAVTASIIIGTFSVVTGSVNNNSVSGGNDMNAICFLARIPNAGNRVYPRSESSGTPTIAGSLYTTFSGFLIQ